MLFPNIIYEVAKNYNNAHLYEVNDIGDQVAVSYSMTEYQNLLMCSVVVVRLLVRDFLAKKHNLA